MKKCNAKALCLTGIITGAAGFFLRLGVYRTAMDPKGLMVRWHPLAVALTVLALVLMAAAWAMGMTLKKEKCLAPAGKLPAAGSLVLAAGLALSMGAGEGWTVLVTVLCGLAIVGLVLGSFSQWKGKQPHFLCNAGLCLFLALYLVTRYRVWSRNPQVLDVLPAICGLVCLMVYAYHMAAGNLGEGLARPWAIVGTWAVFFCLTGASAGEARILCLTGAVYAAAGLAAGPRPGEEARS